MVFVADVDGSLDAILEVVGTYNSHDICELNIIHSGVGPITLSDVEAAETFQGKNKSCWLFLTCRVLSYTLYSPTLMFCFFFVV